MTRQKVARMQDMLPPDLPPATVTRPVKDSRLVQPWAALYVCLIPGACLV